MKFTNNGQEVTINFDPYGNLYIDHNQKIYQINVNGSGIPILDQGSYTILSPYVKELKKLF